MMTRRASVSSAATAEVSTPFWLSTFCTIAAALPEVACPSVRPECATVQEAPARQQKHPRANTKNTTGSPTGTTHETSCAAARAHFGERLSQLCDDRCHRRACSLSKTPCGIISYPCKSKQANAQWARACKRSWGSMLVWPQAKAARCAMLCSSKGRPPRHSSQSICPEHRRCRPPPHSLPQWFASAAHVQPALLCRTLHDRERTLMPAASIRQDAKQQCKTRKRTSCMTTRTLEAETLPSGMLTELRTLVSVA
jgi:hypothetical protein